MNIAEKIPFGDWEVKRKIERKPKLAMILHWMPSKEVKTGVKHLNLAVSVGK